jgi:uncharacterized protein (TIGR03437 family)
LYALAQTSSVPPLDWRPVGPMTLDAGLASPASGPVDRVWYSSTGSQLFARTRTGRVFVTTDFGNWQPADQPEPLPLQRSTVTERLPEPSAAVAAAPFQRGRMYAAGAFAYRSEDGGSTWENLTAYRSESILGDRLTDVAVSPASGDEIVVAGESGLWRSLDGGISWHGLNDKLPNLPVARLLSVADQDARVRLVTRSGQPFEWRPGQKTGWAPSDRTVLERESALIAAAAAATGASITAVVRAGDTTYAGAQDGRLFVSSAGQAWRPSERTGFGFMIQRIAADVGYGAFAIAITNSTQAGRVLRTVNGGIFWDDITANLPPDVAVYGVTADRATGAVYVASDGGVYMSYTDTVAAGPAQPWALVRPGAAIDVMLDNAGNQLYVALDGSGVHAALAPHRMRDPRIVSAADRVLRAVAPGALVAVIGAKVRSLQADGRAATVLAAGDVASEVHLPFELPGGGVVLSVESTRGRFQIGLPVLEASPSIFVDPDGNPVVMNADTGLVLEPAAPARAGARLQILAAGLGRVTPAWPSGLPAPLQDPPRVTAPLRVLLDGEPLEVTRAVLAPGYVGLYLVEVQLPAIVNVGPAELYIQSAGAASNRIRVYLEP